MIDKETPPEIFLTSDTWFGRPQILSIANRMQFTDLKEMHKVLIKNWNKAISKDDIVFHLGNFAWDPKTAADVLKKLNGKIFFLVGSADEALLEVYKDFENVNIIEGQIVELPKYDSIICHYPLSVWNGKDSGTIHFHGHTVYSHQTNLELSNRVNVCTDFWNYTPIKFSTIKDFINGKR